MAKVTAMYMWTQVYGHHVRLATHSNFRGFVKSAGVDFYPLGGDPRVLAGCKRSSTLIYFWKFWSFCILSLWKVLSVTSDVISHMVLLWPWYPIYAIHYTLSFPVSYSALLLSISYYVLLLLPYLVLLLLIHSFC